MNCIYQRNPLSGFCNSHTIFCAYCEEPAVVHFYLPYACGNICESCAKKKFKRDETEEGIYVSNNEN